MVCYINHSIKKFTQYYCKPCLAPVCPINCYDLHRKERFIESVMSDWNYQYIYIYNFYTLIKK